MTAIVGLVGVGGPTWLLIIFATLLILGMFLYGTAYVFSLTRNPDWLRSETYSIQKMAIEHGVYGDSQLGLIEASDPKNTTPLIEVQSSESPIKEEKNNHG